MTQARRSSTRCPSARRPRRRGTTRTRRPRGNLCRALQEEIQRRRHRRKRRLAETESRRPRRYCVKLQPGTTKKGKAARDALEILARRCDDAAARDLVRGRAYDVSVVALFAERTTPEQSDAAKVIGNGSSSRRELGRRAQVRGVDANEAILALVGGTKITNTEQNKLKKDRQVDEKHARRLKKREGSEK